MEPPSDPRYITMRYMKDYVIEKGPEDITWLIDVIEAAVDTTDGGGPRGKRAFSSVRTAFVEKYFPELAPDRHEKVNIMDAALKELYSVQDGA